MRHFNVRKNSNLNDSTAVITSEGLSQIGTKEAERRVSFLITGV